MSADNFTVEMRNIGELRASPRNYNAHPPEQIVRLADSLKTHGQEKPLVITEEGEIIAGHGLWEGAKHLGWSQMACHVYHGSNASAYLVADNYLATLAQPDDALLADLLSSLNQAGDLSASGYYEQEFEELRKRIEQPSESELADAIGGLPAGDKPPFEQMTFTLHESQAEQVREALAQAKVAGPFADSPNENSNGNALARICETFLTGGV